MAPSHLAEHIGHLSAADGTQLTYGICRAPAAKGTLVLLHGMASNMTRWSEFIRNTSLRQSWNIIRLDLRGHARSIYRGRITPGIWSDDLATILQHEGLSRAVVAGHCMGANLAVHFASHYPTLTQSVILIEPIVRDALQGTLRRAARLTPLIVTALPLLRVLASCGLHRRQLPELDLYELDQKTRTAMAELGKDFPSERYGAVREDLRYVPWVVYLQDLLAVTAELPQDALQNTPALAMLCTGTGFTNREATRAWLESQPACQIEIVPAAHWIPTEQPDTMRELIEHWCATQTGQE